ncbi:MAG: phosphatidylglycerophosphatase A [Saprospiraceae bacterium]
MKSLHKLNATVLGAGYSPFAPGTMGALVGILVLFLIKWQQPELQYFTWGLLLATIVFTLLGVWSTNELESEWGKDPSKVVVDELIGVWIAVLWIPIETQWLILGFILFRFFDILKPLGIRRLESIKGGWGVMLDDLGAGIYANIVLQIIVYFWS